MAINEELDFLVSRVAKVRKWLAAIAILKTSAICLLFACVYIGGYILLDHRFNFSLPGRLIAFVLLVGSAAYLVLKLSRLLLVQISFTNAANFIENNYSLNQQLVAAMEYYENKADYPYSKVLAEQLILRVNKDSESFQFDSVIEKWRGFALAAFVSIGLTVVGFYVLHNLAFLKTYLSRLAVPFASVAPVSATSLETITGDIVSEPESMLVFSAKINGRIPDSGQLIISPVGQDSNDQILQIRPIENSESDTKFETSEFFAKSGQFQYRFEADLAQTQWHNIDIRYSPKIKSITAEVKLPESIRENEILKNYTELVKNNSIEIIENSSVTLHVECSSNLSEVELTEPTGISKTIKLNGENNFKYTFNANIEGNIEFHLTDDKGLKSKNIPKLKIKLKKDNPPEFKLISPEGDYLATNVSSVPIEFEITDDFGLSSAEFVAEFPGKEPVSIEIPVQPDSNQTQFKTILELEQYDLEIGDSIMFYANATDIKTAISNKENSASSEIYFIEIRPYLQIWHINEGGGKSEMPGMVKEDLTTLLEYTRAFIKKTSVVAGKSNLSSEDHSQIRAINEDVDYCSSLLVQLRDNPLNNFNDLQKEILNEILSFYEKASDNLKRYNTDEALINEKEAYRILRKIILEIEMDYNPPEEGGQSIPKETPDKAELKTNIETPEIKQEQIEEELENVQNDIEELQVEQNKLQTELEKALEQQKNANEQAKAKSQAEQLSDSGSGQGNGSPSQQSGDSKQPGNSPGQANGSPSQQSGDSQQPGNSPGQGNGSPSQQSGDSQQPGNSPGQGNGSPSQQSGDSQQPGNSPGQGNGSPSQQSGDSQQPGNNPGQGNGSSDQQSGDSQQPGNNPGQGNGSPSQQGGDSQQPGNSPGQGNGSSDQQSGDSQQGNNSSDQGNGTQGQPGENSQHANNGSEQKSGSNNEQNPQSSQNPSQASSNEKTPEQVIAEAQLKMLQAKQMKLQNDVSQLQQKLEAISKNSEGNISDLSQDVKNQLGEALEYMEKFQNKMDELQYQPQEFDKKADEASKMMDSAADKLDSADTSLDKALKGSKEKQLADELKKNADLLTENPDKLDDQLTEQERKRMEALREAALRLLENNAGAQEVTTSRGSNSSSVSGTHVLTERGGTGKKETAIEIARDLRFLAIELEKRKEQPIEEEPSDSRFFEAESDFFENAAKYNTGENRK